MTGLTDKIKEMFSNIRIRSELRSLKDDVNEYTDSLGKSNLFGKIDDSSLFPGSHMYLTLFFLDNLRQKSSGFDIDIKDFYESISDSIEHAIYKLNHILLSESSTSGEDAVKLHPKTLTMVILSETAGYCNDVVQEYNKKNIANADNINRTELLLQLRENIDNLKDETNLIKSKMNIYFMINNIKPMFDYCVNELDGAGDKPDISKEEGLTNKGRDYSTKALYSLVAFRVARRFDRLSALKVEESRLVNEGEASELKELMKVSSEKAYERINNKYQEILKNSPHLLNP